MSIMENREVRNRLTAAFPKLFINHNYELIIEPKRNTYFSLKGVNTESELNAKILEWLSREAAKSVYPWSQKYHLEGINRFLGTHFSQQDMYEIYSYLGNAVDHEKTLRFLASGYNMDVLYG